MRVTACSFYAVAGKFVAFAVWAAFGFAFPAGPLPLALNINSKILCFVAAIMLFVWREHGSPLGEVSGAGSHTLHCRGYWPCRRHSGRAGKPLWRLASPERMVISVYHYLPASNCEPAKR